MRACVRGGERGNLRGAALLRECGEPSEFVWFADEKPVGLGLGCVCEML